MKPNRRHAKFHSLLNLGQLTLYLGESGLVAALNLEKNFLYQHWESLQRVIG